MLLVTRVLTELLRAGTLGGFSQLFRLISKTHQAAMAATAEAAILIFSDIIR